MAEICAEVEANSNWPKKDQAQTMIWVKSWHSMFGAYEKDKLLNAVRSVLKKYPEVKPHLIAQELELIQAAEDPNFLTPDDAWRRLQKRINEGWSYKKIKESLAYQKLSAVEYAIDTIGWQTIVEADGDSLSFIRKEFIHLIKQHSTIQHHVKCLSECDPKVTKLIQEMPVKRIQ